MIGVGVSGVGVAARAGFRGATSVPVLGEAAALTPRHRSSTNAAISGTTLTCNKPSGASVGDVLVASWSTRAAVADADMDLPANWVQVAYNAVTQPTHKLAYRIVGASEPASYDFVMAASVAQSVAIECYRGVDTSNPSDVAATTNSGTSGTTMTATGLTTVTPNAMLIAAFCNNNVTGTAITDPADMTERSAVTAQCRNTVSELLLTEEGATGNKTATQGATARWSAILWALRPAVVAESLTADATITIDGLTSVISRTIPAVALVENPPLWGGAGWDNAKVSLPQAVGAYKVHIFPFGLLDPWDSDSSGPTEANPSLWATGNRLTTALTRIRECDPTAPIILTLYSGSWWMKGKLHSTNGTTTLMDYTERFSDDGRVMINYLDEWLVMVDEAVTLAAAQGCRDFEIWNEAKGFYSVPAGTGQTWDARYEAGTANNANMGYSYFAEATANQVEATMTGLGYLESEYRVGAPYPVLSTKGTLDGSDHIDEGHPLYQYGPQWGYANKAPINFTREFLGHARDHNIRLDVLTLDLSTFLQSGTYPSSDPFDYTEKFAHVTSYWRDALVEFDFDPDMPIDYGEAYGFPYPALQVDGQEELRAAMWADVYRHCLFNRVRYVTAWSAIGLAQGQNADESGLITDPRNGADAGQLTLVGEIAKDFKDNFGPGVEVFPINDNAFVNGFGSATKLRLWNKTANDVLIAYDGELLAFTGYEYKKIDL